MSGQPHTSPRPGYGQAALWIMGLTIVALVTLGTLRDMVHLHDVDTAYTTAPQKQSGRGKSRYVRTGGETKGFETGKSSLQQIASR